MRNESRMALCGVVALVCGLVAPVVARPDAPAPAAQGGAPKAPYESLIKPKDAVLFIGDDFVLGSAWPRMVEAGLLRVRPGDHIRYANAGWPGATVDEPTDAADTERPEVVSRWLQRLVFTARPSVVFLCFGASDAARAMREGATPGATAVKFEHDLDALVTKTLSLQVRTVVIVTPSVAERVGAGAAPGDQLAGIAEASGRVAKARGLLCIDTFAPTTAALKKAAEEGAAAPRLTRDGLAPSEIGSLVVASAVLRDLGVSAADLSRLGWAPAPPAVFERARPLLATDIRPEPKEMERTFAVVQALEMYDEHFDVLWRELEMRLHPTHSRRAEILSLQRMEVENNWRDVEEAVKAGAPAGDAPPKEKHGAIDKPKAIEIAKAAVAANDNWADRATYEAQADGEGWNVTAWRIEGRDASGNPQYVPGGERMIQIDSAGKVTGYLRGS